MFVVWWAQELARKLPSGMAVYTVSPGAGYGTDVSGSLYASAPKKIVEPVEVMHQPHFHDRTDQAAAWEAVVEVAGGVDYPFKA